MINIDNVKKVYNDEVEIGPLNIKIPKAGLTSVIGPNGAGKSTTLLMIGRLLDMDEGSIAVAYMNVSKSKSEDLAKILTILRQENHFITRLTVRQLVGFGGYTYLKGRLTKEDGIFALLEGAPPNRRIAINTFRHCLKKHKTIRRFQLSKVICKSAIF